LRAYGPLPLLLMSFGTFAGITAGLQFLYGPPLTTEIGPVEFLEAGYVGILVGGLALLFGVFRSWRSFRAVWLVAAALLVSVAFAKIATLVRGDPPASEPYDFSTLVGLALTGLGLVLILHFDRLALISRRFLYIGFALQMVGALGDLADGDPFTIPHIPDALIGGAEQLCNLLFISTYGIGFLLFARYLITNEMVEAGGLLRHPRQMWRYLPWQMKHPQSSYRDWYLAKTLRRIECKGMHKSLGRVLRPDQGRTVRGVMAALLRYGLEPHHTLVDYGCGSLRFAEPLIDYLESHRYIGLDITDMFYLAGLERIDPALVARKRPRFEIISPETLGNVAKLRPDFVFCRSVIHHVPSFELRRFLANLLSLAGDKTLCLLVIPRPRMQMWRKSNWRHSLGDIMRHVEELGFRADVENPEGAGKLQWLRIHRLCSTRLGETRSS